MTSLLQRWLHQDRPLPRAQQHLLFAVCTGIAIPLIGYHFGSFDQVVHLPFLKAWADPTLYPGDPFVALRAQAYSYFWLAFVPFQRAGVLEAVLFAAHCVAVYLTFWAVWSLSTELFDDIAGAQFATVAFVFPHLAMAGFPIVEFSLLGRTVALPLLLFTILLYLRGYRRWAFLALGLLFNIHVVNGVFVLGMFLLDTALTVRRRGLLEPMAGLVLFLVAASPVLAWKLGNGSIGSAFASGADWVDVVGRAIFAHIYGFFGPAPYIPFFTATGLAAMALFHLSGPARDRFAQQCMQRFMASVWALLALQLLTGLFYPVTIVQQLQIIRAGTFGAIFGYLYFANHLVGSFRRNEMDAAAFSSQALVLAVAPTAVFSLLLGWGHRLMAWTWTPTRHALIVGGVSVVTLGCVPVLVAWQMMLPGIYIHARSTPWVEAQLWAKHNTPVDAIFIVPPNRLNPVESDWRVFAERQSLASLSDLLEIALVPDYLPTWRERFEAIAPGAIGKFDGNYFHSLRIAGAAYDGLTDRQLAEVARKYSASFAVVQKPGRREFPIVYENDDFVVYDLRATTQVLASLVDGNSSDG